MERNLSVRLAILLWILILVGCSSGKSDGTEFHTPPSYQGIVPGQTTEEEVLSILGEPEQTSVSTIDEVRYWEYHSLRVVIAFPLENQVVSWIFIEDQTNTLGEVVSRYGEPELTMMTSSLRECPSYEYALTRLDYPKYGVSAITWNIPPLSRDMILTDLLYFEPMTLEAYFEQFGPLTGCDKVIEWPGFESP